MAKIDVERVITEYYMLKTVLKNKYALARLNLLDQLLLPTKELCKQCKDMLEL